MPHRATNVGGTIFGFFQVNKNMMTMARIKRGNHFLSGFGNENFIEEFYMDRTDGLKPSIVLSENDDQYKLDIGIPFLEKEDITLEIDGNELSISGIQGSTKKELYTVFFIPVDVKIDQISASFENGLLSVELPKSEIDKSSFVLHLN